MEHVRQVFKIKTKIQSTMIFYWIQSYYWYYREFFENSTIHGLNYIVNSERLIKVVWIGIVTLGFSLSGVLIWHSFENWQKNPVETTISTHPIEKVSFPKIYVCPPKDTYTNLNQDIIDMKNVSLTSDQMEQLQILGWLSIVNKQDQ